VNAGGSFIEQGLQQINVRSVGLVRDVKDIEQTVIKDGFLTPSQICSGTYAALCTKYGVK